MEITLLFCLILCVYVVLIKLTKKNTIYIMEYNMLGYMLLLNIMSAICYPLMMHSMEFYRLQRNLLIIDFIAIQGFIKRTSMLRYKLYLGDVLINILLIILAFYYLFFDSVFWNYDTVFAPLFRLIGKS